jgi:hypothetical protein
MISSVVAAVIGNGDAFSKFGDFAARLDLLAKQTSTGDSTPDLFQFNRGSFGDNRSCAIPQL